MTNYYTAPAVFVFLLLGSFNNQYKVLATAPSDCQIAQQLLNAGLSEACDLVCKQFGVLEFVAYYACKIACNTITSQMNQGGCTVNQICSNTCNSNGPARPSSSSTPEPQTVRKAAPAPPPCSGDTSKKCGNVCCKSTDECSYSADGQTGACKKTWSCFPATATVQLANGSTVEIQALQTGDKVFVGGGEYSEVFMWSHRYPEAISTFVQLTTKSGTSITLTAGHYLYVNGVLATAGSVQKGDQLSTASGAKSPVVSIKTITSTGLFNPHTMHGDIVVVSSVFF